MIYRCRYDVWKFGEVKQAQSRSAVPVREAIGIARFVGLTSNVCVCAYLCCVHIQTSILGSETHESSDADRFPHENS